jgi:hypothetical protein
VISTSGAVGPAIQDVIGAVGWGNTQNILNALIAGPGIVLDGFLNGGYGPNLAALVVSMPPIPPSVDVLAGGILSRGAIISPTKVILPGPIAVVLTQRNQIATATDPPAQSSTLAPTMPARAAAAAAASKSLGVA